MNLKSASLRVVAFEIHLKIKLGFREQKKRFLRLLLNKITKTTNNEPVWNKTEFRTSANSCFAIRDVFYTWK